MWLLPFFLTLSIGKFFANGQTYNCDFDAECQWIEGPASHGIKSTHNNSYNISTNDTGLFVVYDSILPMPMSSYLHVGVLLRTPWVISTVSHHCFLEVDTLSNDPNRCQLAVIKRILYSNDTHMEMKDWDWADITPGLNRWKNTFVHIDAEDLPFYLMIKPIQSGNGRCYLALDNIKMRSCQPAHLPYNHYCTFDDNSTCGWHTQGHLTWQLHHGPTPSKQTGPQEDHTLGTAQGFYMYVEGDATAAFDTEILDSQIYLPPPTRGKDQPLCQVRFAYHQYGIDAQHLSLLIANPCAEYNKFNSIKSNGWKKNKWKVLTVNLTDINKPFRLRFSAYKGEGNLGDFALDDISLSPGCFGFDKLSLIQNQQRYKDLREQLTSNRNNEQCPELMKKLQHIIAFVEIGAPETKGASTSTYEFSSCGAKGQSGPSQKQCDTVYKHRLQKVIVTFGVQTWTVPEPGLYSITVIGASGGHGAESVGESRGGYVHGKFNFSKGQKVHVIVGQEGLSGCSPVVFDETKQICGVRPSSVNITPTNITGGGGGGGGASYVFLGDLGTDDLTLLLTAGGGGGLSYNFTQNDSVINGGWGLSGPGVTGHADPQRAGGGGGWISKLIGRSQQTGHGILYTQTPALGGKSCPAASQQGWISSGGFGGGGGGCLSGGGGGGFTGGNASRERNSDYGLHNGVGGTSYVSPEAVEAADEGGIHKGSGSVEFHLSVSCSCSYLCVVADVDKGLYDCLCPAHMLLDKDGHTCIDDVIPPKKEGIMTGHIVIICSGVLLIFVLLISASFIVHYRRRKVARRAARQKAQAPLNLTSDSETGQGPRPLGRRTEVNLYYDFAGTDLVTQDLIKIPRDDITLLRALGQGAFGEVYEGILSNFSRDKINMPVAVKTLPPISTQQAKLDFLMEAVIISKFSHPNIVHFIGICMDKHPGYIVLELLEGGDLKTFLRESRRKAGVPCPLSMKDLLKLSLDVAQGCKHLEQDHFIHRDIAARNCLLTSKGPDRVAKIADFGMARDIYRADYYKKGGRAMLPVKWMPPEAFMDGIFTSKTDVWSFGVLLWEVFSLGLMPYPCRSNQDVMEFVNSGGRMDPPDKCPSAVYNLMMMCWHVTPERRPSFVSLIKKLNSCLQNEEILNAPVASNPVGRDIHYSGGTLSSSSTTPLLSQQASEPLPESPADDQEDISKTHSRAFSKLNNKGYRSVPLSESNGRERTSVCANKRGRLSMDLTSSNPDFVALIPAVSGSSPNIVATTNFSEEASGRDESPTSSQSMGPLALPVVSQSDPPC